MAFVSTTFAVVICQISKAIQRTTTAPRTAAAPISITVPRPLCASARSKPEAALLLGVVGALLSDVDKSDVTRDGASCETTIGAEGVETEFE